MYKGLILSEPFGLGHTMAARALYEGMQAEKLSWDIEMLELSKGLSPLLSRTLSSLYTQMLKRSPVIWSIMYHHSQHKTSYHPLTFFLKKLLYRKITSLLSSKRPEFIICTHPFPSMILASLKAKYNFQLYNCITDYGFHGSWVNPGVDHYFLPDTNLLIDFKGCGIDGSKMTVCGLPIRQAFAHHIPQEQARLALQLHQLPTLLCLGGGLGLGLKLDGYAQILSPLLNRMQVLIVTGKNIKAYQEWMAHPIAKDPNLHVYGFVEHIDLLMDASNLIITKPGAITCTEALAKRLPMLLIDPVPGQEEKNLQYFKQNNLAIQLVNHQHLASVIQRWIDNQAVFYQQFAQHKIYYQPEQVIQSFIHTITALLKSQEHMNHLSKIKTG